MTILTDSEKSYITQKFEIIMYGNGYFFTIPKVLKKHKDSIKNSFLIEFSKRCSFVEERCLETYAKTTTSFCSALRDVNQDLKSIVKTLEQ